MIIKTLIQGEYEDYADQAENFRAAINKQVQDRKVEAIETGIAVSPFYFSKSKTTLLHGNKAKPICTAIRPSSKFWKIILHRNKAQLENFKSYFASQ